MALRVCFVCVCPRHVYDGMGYLDYVAEDVTGGDGFGYYI